MNRRTFLHSIGVGLATVAAPAIVLAEPEPLRRFWQVGRNAPVADHCWAGGMLHLRPGIGGMLAVPAPRPTSVTVNGVEYQVEDEAPQMPATFKAWRNPDTGLYVAALGDGRTLRFAADGPVWRVVKQPDGYYRGVSVGVEQGFKDGPL